MSLSGVGAGVGPGIGFGAATGSVGNDDFAGALVGSGGSVASGSGAVVDEGTRVGMGVEVPGAAVFRLGVEIPSLTVVEEPVGADTSTPAVLVSTVPLIVTTVASPSGETETYESDPARMTEAIPALRTS